MREGGREGRGGMDLRRWCRGWAGVTLVVSGRLEGHVGVREHSFE